MNISDSKYKKIFFLNHWQQPTPLKYFAITLYNQNITVQHKYTTIYEYTSIANIFPLFLLLFLVQNTHRASFQEVFHCGDHGRLQQHLPMLKCCSVVWFAFLRVHPHRNRPIDTGHQGGDYKMNVIVKLVISFFHDFYYNVIM